jgi:hypothetical protein
MILTAMLLKSSGRTSYSFQSPEKLVADFDRDITKWNHENRRS